MSARYSFPAGSTPSAGGPNPLRPYYTGSDSPLQSYYNTSNTPALLDEDLAPAEFNSQAALKEYANNGLFKYGSLALNAPFEACQTLLQVQYLPNDDLINADEEELETVKVSPFPFCLGCVANQQQTAHPIPLSRLGSRKNSEEYAMKHYRGLVKRNKINGDFTKMKFGELARKRNVATMIAQAIFRPLQETIIPASMTLSAAALGV